MKGKKHRPEQIIKKLREADGMIAAGKTMGQVCQALEISDQTFHRWRNQYGGMKAEGAKRLKELEEENKRLKELLAESELDKAILKEALEGNY
jgi:transposase-like protein